MSVVVEKSGAEPIETDGASENLPPQVLRLAYRERQVATIVYVHGACTAKDVQALLPRKLSNGAVRSMLVRLVAKGLLERKWGKRGRGQGHVYLPAIAPAELRERALRDMAEKYFGGSLLSAAMSALKLLGQEGGERPSDGTSHSVTVPFELPLQPCRRPAAAAYTLRATG